MNENEFEYKWEHRNEEARVLTVMTFLPLFLLFVSS